LPVTVFEDFSGGEAGTLDASKIPDNFFKAKNVLLYRSGALGPRGGLKTFGLGRTVAATVNMFGYSEAGTRSLVWQEGTTVYGGDPAGVAAATTLGTVDLAANVPNPYADYAPQNAGFATPGGTIYALNHFAATPISGVSTAQITGGTALSQYELFAISNQKPAESGGFQTAGRRLRWSEPLDFTTWTGFQDILFGGEISYMAPIKDYLVLGTSTGQWYVITGTLDVNHRLRRIGGPTFSPPFMPPAAFVAPGDDLVYALSPRGNFPIVFDGVEARELRYLNMIPDMPLDSYVGAGSTPEIRRVSAANSVKVFQGRGETGVVMVRPDTINKALIKHNEIWTMHSFETAVSQFWTSNRHGTLWCFNRATPVPIVCRSMDLALDRPAFTSDATSQPGDDSTTPFDAYVEFPEVWAKDSGELRVSEVTVDIFRWNTGAPVDNRVQAIVTALSRSQGGNTGSFGEKSATRTWTQAGSSSGTTQDGTADRIKFNFGDQSAAAGFRLRLAGLRGVAVRRVTIRHDGEPRPTRSYK